MPGAPRRIRIVAVVAALAAAASFSSVAFAHDEIESSIPEHKAQIQVGEPITEVTINFGEPVDGVELGLRGPDDERIAGDVTVISGTQARLNFAKLTDEGQYIVQYLAEEDGHLVAGAITFTYGNPSWSGCRYRYLDHFRSGRCGNSRRRRILQFPAEQRPRRHQRRRHRSRLINDRRSGDAVQAISFRRCRSGSCRRSHSSPCRCGLPGTVRSCSGSR